MKEELIFEKDGCLNELVTFVLEGEYFAIDMAPVQEIIRVPEMVKVPKSPPSLMGLANLRGTILPIINLRKVFGLPDREVDDSSRVIVINLGQTFGFLVDKVLSVINAEVSDIEDATQVQSIVRSEFLKGVVKTSTYQRMILLLHMERILSSEFSEISLEGKKGYQTSKTKEIYHDEELKAEERQLVSFIVEGEEYAIDIDTIQEIVQIPEHIVRVPKAESSVVGIMNLRNKILPLTSIRKIFHLEEKSLDESSRILVITHQGLFVGIVVDGVKEVLRVPHALIEPVSLLLFKDEERPEITEICKLNEGKRLVFILSVPHLLKNKAMKEALSTMETEKTQEEIHQLEGKDEEEQVVVFKLMDDEYAVPIEAVQEIVRIPEELTCIPKTPNFVEGVMNLRGSVLPVIDLRKRLGLKAAKRDENQRIIVLAIDNVSVGFIVDSVTEVLKIPKNLIFPTPSLSAEQVRLFPKVANFEKEGRIIQFLEPQELLNKEEIKQLCESYE